MCFYGNEYPSFKLTDDGYKQCGRHYGIGVVAKLVQEDP